MRGFQYGVGLVLSCGGIAGAAVDYARDIKPLLTERCLACHGALKQKAGLRLDTVAAMRLGGDEGDVLKGSHALLLQRVTTTDLDERMPPEGEGAAFTEAQVALLKEWIAMGAPGPADEVPEADPREHWAYHAPVASAGTLDELLEARRAEKGVKVLRQAAPGLWLRRVSLDLIGLPPTVAELRSFEKEMANTVDPRALRARVVERLLASPQYGERWARHFMDIWRYSDWYGLGAQMRYSHKHLWHWRDWMVESLNGDKGYDEMVTQMLAADELDPQDTANLRATGFLARSYYLFNRTTWLDATIEHTSRAFLGLTMQCVKCHDHKYDPVDQEEYYRMRAIFEPVHVRLDAVPGVTDFEKGGLPRVFDLHVERATYRHVRGDEANEDKSKTHAPGVPKVLSWDEFKAEPVRLPVAAYRPGTLEQVLRDQLAVAEAERQAAVKKVESLRAAGEAKVLEESGMKGRVVFEDDFSRKRAGDYVVLEGDWVWEKGRLIQRETGLVRRMVELRAEVSRDFSVQARFVIQGGQRWKSVGVAFDGQGADDTLVYLSAAEGGSKVQVAPTAGGSASYPGSGAKALPVETGREYLLEVRVQGQRVNVLLDGELRVAHDLERPRAGGALRLAAFDAQAAFSRVRVTELAQEIRLAEKVGDDGKTAVADPVAALALAELELAAAELKPERLRCAQQAELAFGNTKLAAAAAEAEARHEAALARVSVAKAAAGLKNAKEAKVRQTAEKTLKDAKTSLAKAEERMRNPGQTYQPLRAVLKAQEGPDDAGNAAVQRFPETSTGRRLAFARWVTDRRHPLTARVLVNQVWLRHFGASLVEDVTDFGRRTKPPVQQAVLDTLAVRFMESGWSLKALHREMVLSDLYATTSSQAEADAATLSADPDNALYWRMNPRRMESQVVRDSLLHLSGRLDLTMGGQTVDPMKAETSTRRALYFNQTAFDQHRFLGGFDNANVLECYRREVSVMPQQALALSNSRESADCAAALAKQHAVLTDAELVVEAFLLVLGREPGAEERAVCEAALKQMRRDLFLQGLLNHNDFITVR